MKEKGRGNIKTETLNTLVVGPLEVNCYILGSAGLRDGIVIDPGDEGERIYAETQELGIDVKWILNTHAHPDHTGAVWYFMKKTGASLLIHQADMAMLTLTNPGGAGKGERFRGQTPEDAKPGVLQIADGDVIRTGSLEIRVIHTPGHTKGGVCFLRGKRLFSGDTLFEGSIGRTDFPGGSYEELISSVREKLFPLGDEVEVFPGHGPSTTIGFEKRENPFFSGEYSG